jgi:RimJ/RimL family protein N-acetyltransferase
MTGACLCSAPGFTLQGRVAKRGLDELTFLRMELPRKLATARLMLREPRLSDAAAIFEGYTQDAGVAKYMVWTPHETMSVTSSFLADCVAGWEERTRLPYVLPWQREARPSGCSKHDRSSTWSMWDMC